MDILSQALSVAERAEGRGGRVAITFDLEDSDQRAAFAAAVAVLKSLGIEPESLFESGLESGGTDQVLDRAAEDEPNSVPAGADDEGDEAQDGSLRRDFATAIGSLTPEAARRDEVVRDTFPRVRELLRDGANVEAVAQIQYRRWIEENLHRIKR